MTEYLSMNAFAKERGVSTTRIRQLVLQGRVKGAEQEESGTNWKIPKDAKIRRSIVPFKKLK
jgi:hypothetical protein